MANTYSSDNREFAGGTSLPLISQDLDSIRAYQWEIKIELPNSGVNESLSLAAKQVTTIGFTTEDIEVHRLNDRVYYPGKSTPEEVTITFDNLYNKDVATTLWNWYSGIYNPMTGRYNEGSGSAGSPAKLPKANAVTVLLLGPSGEVLQETRMYGVYPKAWKTAEFNYSTNEFHTIELTLRYDFMEHIKA